MEIHNQIAEHRDYKNSIVEIEKGRPIIWLYWENKDNKATPAIIELCRETIIRKNWKDFQIIVTNPQNIFFYLPGLNKSCLLLEKIAHRADYVRFNLLYHYGGIWLDSDFIAFKSLKPVLNKIEEYGFVYTGYLQDDGNVFPLVAFLGAQKHNLILKGLIENIDEILEKKVKRGVQPEWNEIGGYALQKYLNDKNSFRFEPDVFAPVNVHADGQTKLFFPIKISKAQRKKSYGQMLPYSVYAEFFSFMDRDIVRIKCYMAEELKNNLDIKTTEKISSLLLGFYIKFYEVTPVFVKKALRCCVDALKKNSTAKSQ